MWGSEEPRLGRPQRLLWGLDLTLWEWCKHWVWEASSSSRKLSMHPGISLSRLLFGCCSSRAALPQALLTLPLLALAVSRTRQGC